MGFYDFTSTLFTVLGHIVLIYRIIFELEAKKKKKSIQQKLCTNWVIFIIFLKIQYWILAIIEIIPLGALSLLVVKLMLFLPQNRISAMIYKKIQKKLQKMSLDEYNSQLGIYISWISKHIVIIFMKSIKKLSPYINSKDIQQTQSHILDIIKVLQYKKAAIHIRSQAHASEINQELNMTQFDRSVSQEQHIKQAQLKVEVNEDFRKSNIGNQMSRILADFDDEDDKILKTKAELMIVKPNKEKNIKPKFEDVSIEVYMETLKLNIIDKNKAVQSGTLKEVKWVTKNMINLELVFAQGRSKIIRLKDKADVPKWVEPVCTQLKKRL